MTAGYDFLHALWNCKYLIHAWLWFPSAWAVHLQCCHFAFWNTAAGSVKSMCTHCLTSSCHPKHSALQVHSLEGSFLSCHHLGNGWKMIPGLGKQFSCRKWQHRVINGLVQQRALMFLHAKLWIVGIGTSNLADSEKIYLCDCRGMMFWDQCYKVLCLIPVLSVRQELLSLSCAERRPQGAETKVRTHMWLF